MYPDSIGTLVEKGDEVGYIADIEIGNHLDVKYYEQIPPDQGSISEPAYLDIDEARNPIFELQNADGSENPLNEDDSDDENFEIVLNNIAQDSFNEQNLIVNNNIFENDPGGDNLNSEPFIYFGARVDNDELDFSSLAVDVFEFNGFGSKSLVTSSTLLSDNSSNLSSLWDNYAELNYINYSFKWNVGDMDGNGDGDAIDTNEDRLDNGLSEFNDIRVTPRKFLSNDPFHTVFFSFYTNLNSVPAYYKFIMRFDNVDNDISTFTSDTLWVFYDDDAYLGNFSGDNGNNIIGDGSKGLVLEDLTIENGATLRIESGGMLYLAPGTGLDDRREIFVEEGGTANHRRWS